MASCLHEGVSPVNAQSKHGDGHVGQAKKLFIVIDRKLLPPFQDSLERDNAGSRLDSMERLHHTFALMR